MLEEIKATHLPLMTVWNKVDACAQPQKIREIASRRPNTVAVSAETGDGIPDLLEVLETLLSKQLKNVHCLVPYTQVCSPVPTQTFHGGVCVQNLELYAFVDHYKMSSFR